MSDMTLLRPCLTRLKLSGILEKLPERLQEAEEQKSGYTEFLLSILQDEIERRDYHTLRLRLARSNLDSSKTLETFDFACAPNLSKAVVKEFCSCNFISNKENIFFLGASGAGKTHLAQAIGHEAARRGYDVYCERTAVILQQINAARGDGTSERKLKYFKELPLLVLDDFGLQEITTTQQDDLYEIICGRYENASTIITSNRDVSEWFSIFRNQLIASAAVDRLVHRAHKIVIETESYRLKQFNDRYADQIKN